MTTIDELESKYKTIKPMGSMSLDELESNYQKISTITGQPNPSFDVDMAMRKNALEKSADVAFPIVGDIALTALAPQLKIVEKAPMLVRAGKSGINLLSRAASSAAGGGFGEAASQQVSHPGSLNLDEITRQIAIGGASELGGSALLGGLKLGTKIARGTAGIVGDFTKLSRPLSRWASKIQNKIKLDATKKALDFMDDISVPSKEDVGMSVGNVLKKKVDYQEIYKTFNKKIDDAALMNKGEILLEGTPEYLRELQNEFINYAKANMPKRLIYNEQAIETEALKNLAEYLGWKSDTRTLMTLKEIMMNGYIGPNDAKYVMGNFWKKSYGNTTDRANQIKEEIKTIFLHDIDEVAPGAKFAKEKADKIFSETKKFVSNNPAVQKALQKMDFGRSDALYFEAYPERFYDNLLSKSTSELITIGKEVTKTLDGVAAWRMLGLSAMQDMFKKAVKENMQEAGQQMFYPMILAKEFAEKEQKLKVLLPISQFRKLQKEVEYFKNISSSYESIPVGDGFDMFEAWSILNLDSKKKINSAIQWGSKNFKWGLKSATHPIMPELMKAHGNDN